MNYDFLLNFYKLSRHYIQRNQRNKNFIEKGIDTWSPFLPIMLNTTDQAENMPWFTY